MDIADSSAAVPILPQKGFVEDFPAVVDLGCLLLIPVKGWTRDSGAGVLCHPEVVSNLLLLKTMGSDLPNELFDFFPSLATEYARYKA